jgi:hypothetical protein
MNPYLEHPHFWVGFHHTYLTFLRSALLRGVGPNYDVEIEEHVYLSVSEDERALIGRADVDVSMDPEPAGDAGGTAVATLAAPATVTLPKLKKRKVGYLRVVDRRDHQVVTVVELLSPSNKYAGEDRESYLTKRREFFATRVSLIELDFLRGGPRLPLKGLPACDYYVMISRPTARPKADMWPVVLRQPLPTVPVPVREGEVEGTVDLQAVLHRAFDEGGFARRIYRTPPEPQLAPADADGAAARTPAAPKG